MPCSFKQAGLVDSVRDVLLLYGGVQLQNKQDWARLRSYEVHQMAELVDSHMRPGPWQKVGMIRKVHCAPIFSDPPCILL
jgi:hypothetical protein